MTLKGQNKKMLMFGLFRKKNIVVWIILCIGVILSFVLFNYVQKKEKVRLQEEFNNWAEAYSWALQFEINEHLEVIYSLGGFFATDRDVNRDEFAAFVQNIILRHPDILGLDWIPRILDPQRQEFEKSFRIEGYHEFKIKRLDEEGHIVKAAKRPEYFPIYYSEPFKNNLDAIGFDAASDPVRYEAMKEAVETGLAIATRRIKLLTRPGKEFGYRIFLPIYHYGKPVNTAEDRYKNLKGFVGARFYMPEMVDLVFRKLKFINMNINLYDITNAEVKELLYGYKRDTRDILTKARIRPDYKLQWSVPFDMANRKWLIYCESTSNFLIGHKMYASWLVLCGGLVLVILFTGYLNSTLNRAIATEQIVEKRTAELTKTNKQLEEAIKRREEIEAKLKESMEIKSKFVSHVSHEFRTPLAVVKESINIILDGSAGEINEEQKDFLDTAKRNLDRLARLINNVLNFQKLEVDKEQFNFEAHNINQITEEIYGAMYLSLKQKGLDFAMGLDSNIPDIRFDKDKIIQVIMNLVNNALKFTKKGSVTIATKKIDNAVQVIVRDTGIGIKAEEMTRLFQVFEQLGTSNDRRNGSGLGLVICKEIIERHGGKIWAESEFGKGTAFYFNLPLIEKYS